MSISKMEEVFDENGKSIGKTASGGGSKGGWKQYSDDCFVKG